MHMCEPRALRSDAFDEQLKADATAVAKAWKRALREAHFDSLVPS